VAVKRFAEMTTDALVEAGAALANMRVHPGWPVLVELLERLDGACLERMAECTPDELTRLQGERDAVRTLLRLLGTLPETAGALLAERVAEGEADEEELARFALRAGGGDLRL
jgi:hypothetical protein